MQAEDADSRPGQSAVGNLKQSKSAQTADPADKRSTRIGNVKTNAQMNSNESDLNMIGDSWLGLAPFELSFLI